MLEGQISRNILAYGALQALRSKSTTIQYDLTFNFYTFHIHLNIYIFNELEYSDFFIIFLMF